MGDEKQKVCALATEHCPHAAEADDNADKGMLAIIMLLGLACGACASPPSASVPADTSERIESRTVVDPFWESGVLPGFKAPE